MGSMQSLHINFTTYSQKAVSMNSPKSANRLTSYSNAHCLYRDLAENVIKGTKNFKLLVHA